MSLNDTQQQQVAGWLDQGAGVAEIQSRLESEFNLKMTYMEVRFLIDDLKMIPKDEEVDDALDNQKTPADSPSSAGTSPLTEDADQEMPPGLGGVSVSVDQLTQPGTAVSGQVKFSDGQSARWQIDQMGRLGLIPAQPGYRPSPEDVQMFQARLQDELGKMGM